MSYYITKENPIIFLPKLAKIVGMNESLILSLIHFWINPNYNKNFRNNRYWVYNTYLQWQKQLPHLSESTIRRAINKLEKQNILISQNFSPNPYVKLKWYSIDYDTLNGFLPDELVPQISTDIKDNLQVKTNIEKKFFTSYTTDQIDRSDCTDSQVNLTRSYIEQKQHTKTTYNSLSSMEKLLILPKSNMYSLSQNDFFIEKEMISIWNKVFEGERIKLETDLYNIKLLQFPRMFFSENLDLWKDYCEKIASSNFLMGGGANKWKADISWIVKEKNIRKVLTGAYSLNDRKTNINERSLDHFEEEEKVTDPIWKKVTDKLKNSLGGSIYKHWISKLRYLDCNDSINTVNFIAPTNFIKEWINNYYTSKIIQAFREINIEIKYVDIVVDYQLMDKQKESDYSNYMKIDNKENNVEGISC